METVEIPITGTEPGESCPSCGTVALRDGEKTDLDGCVLAEFYECANPECRRTWWVERPHDR